MASEEDRQSWRQLQRVKFSKKALSARAKKAQRVTMRHAHRFLVQRWENIRSVRRHIIGWIIAMGVLIAATALQVLWSQQNYTTDARAAGGTYAEGVLGPIDSLDPLFASSSAELSAKKLLFSSLYSYDDTGHLKGDLATSMTITKNATVYTITIRPNAHWHDGKPVTAQDVVFTLGLIKDPAVHSTITGWQDIGVQALDKTTVQFTLPATYAAFPHALTFPILPEHILAKIPPSSLRENSFSQQPVGSGPFKFSLLQLVDAARDRKVLHLVASPTYYKGEPKLSHFQLHTYDTTAELKTALQLGEINATPDLSIDEVNSLSARHFEMVPRPLSSGVYALFNTTSTILKDRTVRQALQAATDTTALRQHLPGEVQPLDLPFINGQLTGDVPTRPSADPKRAEALLDQAGWKVGTDGIRSKDGARLQLAVVAPKGSQYEKALEILAGQWRAVGVDVNAQVLDTSDANQDVVQNILQPRNFDVLIYTLNIGADPDVYAYWDSLQSSERGLNFSNYSNPVADDALISARSRVEPALRNAKYIAFAKEWLNDVPAIGLYQSEMYYVHTLALHSVDTRMTLVSPTDRYSDVLYWTADTKQVYKTP